MYEDPRMYAYPYSTNVPSYPYVRQPVYPHAFYTFPQQQMTVNDPGQYFVPMERDLANEPQQMAVETFDNDVYRDNDVYQDVVPYENGSTHSGTTYLNDVAEATWEGFGDDAYRDKRVDTIESYGKNAVDVTGPYDNKSIDTTRLYENDFVDATGEYQGTSVDAFKPYGNNSVHATGMYQGNPVNVVRTHEGIPGESSKSFGNNFVNVTEADGEENVDTTELRQVPNGQFGHYPFELGYTGDSYHLAERNFLMGQGIKQTEENDLRQKHSSTDHGGKPYVVDIEDATEDNRTFRTALWTGKHLQVTLMSIGVGDDIGLEIHPNTDQFLRIEDGRGLVQMGQRRDQLTFQRRVSDDDAIMVPAGTWHNIKNRGKKPLKLYSIYAPPEHKFGTVHRTKADAVAAEGHHHRA